jgi:hypothetical protein
MNYMNYGKSRDLSVIWEFRNYFINRQTSGFVEGLNNKIKVIKRRCYGIFNITHLFQRIYLDIEGYSLFYLAGYTNLMP